MNNAVQYVLRETAGIAGNVARFHIGSLALPVLAPVAVAGGAALSEAALGRWIADRTGGAVLAELRTGVGGGGRVPPPDAKRPPRGRGRAVAGGLAGGRQTWMASRMDWVSAELMACISWTTDLTRSPAWLKSSFTCSSSSCFCVW